jgi:tryptophan synthase alpha chain
MGRIQDAFDRAASENRAALIIYLCAGDPTLEATARLVAAIAEAGADVIELGMPFSDPTADGPAIQRASERAIAAGASLRGVLDAVKTIRLSTDVPIVLFGYYNPILAFGEERVVAEAKAVGVDGFLVVDLPPEEAPCLLEPIRRAGLDFVPLIAPTSTKQRIELASSAATSFVYYVSVTGITGAAIADLEGTARRAGEVGRSIERPVALGFGIKTPADVAAVAPHVGGVVVGSATVTEIESSSTVDEAVTRVSALVRALRAATLRA